MFMHALVNINLSPALFCCNNVHVPSVGLIKGFWFWSECYYHMFWMNLVLEESPDYMDGDHMTCYLLHAFIQSYLLTQYCGQSPLEPFGVKCLRDTTTCWLQRGLNLNPTPTHKPLCHTPPTDNMKLSLLRGLTITNTQLQHPGRDNTFTFVNNVWYPDGKPVLL